jgi:hypothetical protein
VIIFHRSPVPVATRPVPRAGTGTVIAVPDSVTIEAKQQLLDSIVEKSGLEAAQRQQVYNELSGIPSQMWRILGQGGLRIVTVSDERDLSQTEAVANFAARDYPDRLQQGQLWLAETIAKNTAEIPQTEIQQAMWQRQQGEALAAALLQDPRCEQFGFEIGVAREPIALESLTGPGDDVQRFATELRTLNGPEVNIEDGIVTARHHVLLLPYPQVDGHPVRPDHLKYMETQDSRMLKAGMGTHYWQSAVVVVHQHFLPDPAPEAGHHRVLVHEVGHAIDHVLERIRNDGFGDQHRATVQRLFEQDSALLASGVQRFSSPRARDNPREYFAEAVEAYLTRTHADAQETKPNNHREWLKQNNRELHDYVEGLFTRTFPPDLELAPLPSRPNYEPPDGLMKSFEKPYKVF